jgi:hypothetical protein
MDMPQEIRRARRQAVPAAAMLASLTFLAAGCSGSPHAAPASSASDGSANAGALAYARCMRSHGISDFPDPNSNGGFAIQNSPGSDLDPNNPRYQAAASACHALAPKAPASGPQARAESLKYSRCMRAHGIKDFPDPNSQGQINLTLPKAGQPPGDLDPSNPRYQSAATACRQYQPGGSGGAPVGGGQGNGGS